MVKSQIWGGTDILGKKSEFAQLLFDFHKIGTNMFGRSMGSHIGAPYSVFESPG